MPRNVVYDVGRINNIVEELKKVEVDVNQIKDFLDEYQEDVKILLEKVSSVLSAVYDIREEILNLSVLFVSKRKEKRSG